MCIGHCVVLNTHLPDPWRPLVEAELSSLLAVLFLLRPQDVILWFFPVSPTASSQAPWLFLPFCTTSKCGHAPDPVLSPLLCFCFLLMSARTQPPYTFHARYRLTAFKCISWSCLSSELQSHMNNCFLDSRSWTSTSISEFHVQTPASLATHPRNLRFSQ